jgi:hypothetical protein
LFDDEAAGAARLIGRSVQEAAREVALMPTSGPMHERAAGDGEDQAYHRHHREGQAADEEGGIEGWANEQKRPLHGCRSRWDPRRTKVVTEVSKKR